MANKYYLGNIKGPRGDTGPQGPPGLKGDKGDPGDTGATGAKGDKGDQGIQGVKGDAGDTGATGAKGADGITYDWLTGTATPSSATGKQGDMYVNTATQDVYKKTSATAWTLQCNIKGATGATGAKGDKGDQGIQGVKGDTGDTGATGAKGADGITYDWLTGAATPSSVTGKQGDMYVNTATQDVYKKTSATAWTLQCNIKGATGAKGDKGDQGIQGVKGDTGERGPIGGGSGTTITIAPYNAMLKSKETADVVLIGDSTDSTKINDAILQLSVGGEIRFLEGTIKCYATINLGSNITISGLGNCTVFQKQFNGIMFSAANKEFVTIKKFKIDADSFIDYNISFSQASNVYIEDIVILNGVNGIIVSNSDLLSIINNKVFTEDFCMRISSSNNLKIINCHFSATSNSTIFSDSAACNKIFIINSTLLSVGNQPVYWRRVHNGGIQNCYIENIEGYTSGSMLQCSYNIVSNNILKAVDNEFMLTSGNHNLCIGNIGIFSNMDNNTTVIINNMG